jgi:imidazolonepropionase-like amidohydrolase
VTPDVLISAAALIDGTGAPAFGPAAVLVQNGRIARVYDPPPDGDLPPGCERVHFDDATLLPGLIDAHVHLCLPGDGTPFPTSVAEPRAVISAIALRNASVALRAGITTLRDCGGFPDVLFGLRRSIELGYAEGPRLVLAGWPLTMTGGHCHYFGGEADAPDGVRAKVRETLKLRVDYIKAMGSGGGTPGTQSWRAAFTQAEVNALVDEAHRFGYRATLHCTCAGAIAYTVNAGADEIQHASFFETPDGAQRLIPEVADALAASGIPVCPTISVGRHVITSVDAKADAAAEERALADRWRHIEQETLSIAAHLHGLGVAFVAGSDAGWRFSPFDALLTELELMAGIGVPPLRCVDAATGRAAAALGIEHQTGTIRPGLAADLVAVRGRPDRDLRALRSIRMVMRAGQRIV